MMAARYGKLESAEGGGGQVDKDPYLGPNHHQKLSDSSNQ